MHVVNFPAVKSLQETQKLILTEEFALIKKGTGL